MLSVHSSFILKLGGGVWHMHLVLRCQAAESGCGHRRAGQGRQRKRYTTRVEEESHNRLPAEDNFQLTAVELPSIRQAHDALLVARQALHIHLLREREVRWRQLC